MLNEYFRMDSLVVGAEAAGMAFVDSLLAYSDATITIIDRRHALAGIKGDQGDVVLDARAYHALRASVAQLPRDLRPDDPVRPLDPTERCFSMPTSPESLSVMILNCALTELASPASHTYRTSQNVRLQC